MKFIVDAQLPKSLAQLLCDKGHDAIHTTELPNGNDTTDQEINKLSILEKRVVVTKDGDFYDSFTSVREPFKLLHIKIGNSSNLELISVFEKNLDKIVHRLQTDLVVQITRNYIITIQ